MSKGWIKIHRKILESPSLKNPNYLAVWMYLLLNAVHSDYDVSFGGKRVTLKPGQLTCGANQIAVQMGVSRSCVERAIARFKTEEQIEVQGSNKCSLITVNNWEFYQKTEEQNEEQTRSQRGTSEEQARTKEECKKNKNVRMKEPDPIPATPEVVAAKDEVNEILSAFQMKLNPAINYGNKTQRNAVSDMLKLMGKEKLLKTIEYATSVSSEQFAPTITTPYQLKEKMAQLIAYHQKQNNKAPNIISI